MKKRIIIWSLVLSLLMGLNINAYSDETANNLPVTTDVTAVSVNSLTNTIGFKVGVPNLSGTIDFVNTQICGGEEYLFLPACADITKLVFHYNAGVIVGLKDKTKEVLIASDSVLSISEYLGKADKNGIRKLNIIVYINNVPVEYTINVMQSANLGAMFINSKEPQKKGLYYIASNKSNKLDGNVDLIDPDGMPIYSGKLSQAKTRGNSTWVAVKKPFQIKLDAKADLIQTGDKANANKTWILLANAFDPTLLHNSVAFEMAKQLGLNAPDSRSVDLYFDGQYLGTYLLTEKVEVSSGRVDIDKKGFLMEIDIAYFAQEENYVIDSSNTPFVIKEPEEVSSKDKEYLTNYMNIVNDALANNGVSTTGAKIEDLVDLDSVAKMYVLQENVKNPDAFVSSTYLYLPTGGKLTAGPVWDFDSSFGIRSDINMNTVAGRCSHIGWIDQFLALPSFKKLVRKYEVSMNSIASRMVGSGINSYVNTISKSQKMNEKCWSDFEIGIYDELPTYSQNVNYFKNFLSRRNSWAYSSLGR